MSILGPFRSPPTLGPFKLTSKSGIDIFGRFTEGILNFGPFTFPSRSTSGASRSNSGARMSTLGPFRSPPTLGPFKLMSKSGMDIFGRFTEGILNFGPFTFPSRFTSGV
ncbi:unnamed protein product [Ranitomeya imitator]|uniref:Uncharacterized protein n=1 Tax=Ranitomeya imitator TaxID=111125 RepID=A0ABN9KZ15_9NEOB|nr:unnamed protein product [Ranitomeya imitator]